MSESAHELEGTRLCKNGNRERHRQALCSAHWSKHASRENRAADKLGQSSQTPNVAKRAFNAWQTGYLLDLRLLSH